jgi:HPt (histidine-containing phosphotransfer) domain-containing protein
METRAIFDLDGILARVDHDWELFQTMVEVFSDQGPKDVAAIHAAVAAGDAAAMAHAAHRLKGAVLQFCAPTVLDVTRGLEESGRAGTLEGASAACAVLETELERLLLALRRTCEQRAST